MKASVNHPVYGEIQYEENVWSGKKTITVNGIAAPSVAKNTFSIGETNAQLSGSAFGGASLLINGESIVLIPKTKWYEWLLAVLPLAFIMMWGNNPALCAVFPVIGGAIGGGIGGLFMALSMFSIKKTDSLIKKALIGLGMLLLTALTGFVVAILFISVLA